MRMRKTTWILLAALALTVAIAVAAFAHEREQMSIGELTGATIKNDAGTTKIDLNAGTSALTNTGHSTLDKTTASFVTYSGNQAAKMATKHNWSAFQTYSGNQAAKMATKHNWSAFQTYSGNQATTSAGKLPKSGGVMTGAITGGKLGSFGSMSTVTIYQGGLAFTSHTGTIGGHFHHFLAN